MAAVEDRMADYQESFHGDTHDQECLTAEDDVFHCIQQVWVDEDEERMG